MIPCSRPAAIPFFVGRLLQSRRRRIRGWIRCRFSSLLEGGVAAWPTDALAFTNPASVLRDNFEKFSISARIASLQAGSVYGVFFVSAIFLVGAVATVFRSGGWSLHESGFSSLLGISFSRRRVRSPAASLKGFPFARRVLGMSVLPRPQLDYLGAIRTHLETSALSPGRPQSWPLRQVCLPGALHL